jgi:16S rRNA (adenine1518-N6/adenine1519-N6)-dimethyltransferase
MQRNPDKKLRCNEVLFKKVVKLAFNQRRKMLRNSLKSLLDDVQLDNPAILNLRPEQLSVAEFEKIVLNIEKKNVILHLL